MVAWLLVCILAISAGTFEDPKADYTLDEIKAGLLARQAAFQNLQFQAEAHGQRRIIRGAPLKEYVQQFKFLLDRSDRKRIEQLDKSGSHEIIVIDKEYRSITVEKEPAGGKYGITGTRRRELGVPLPAQPAELLNLNTWSVPKFYEEVPLNMGSTGEAEGTRVVELIWESSHALPDGSLFRGSILVAPSYGFAVVSNITSFRPKAGLDWKPGHETKSKGFVRYGPLWVPSQVHHVSHGYYDDGGYELMHEFTLDLTDWAVNRTLKPDTFQLDFPDGTLLSDKIKGGPAFVVKRVTDSSISAQIEKIKKLQSELSDTESNGGKPGPFTVSPALAAWALAAVGALLLVAAVVAAVRWRDHTSHR